MPGRRTLEQSDSRGCAMGHGTGKGFEVRASTETLAATFSDRPLSALDPFPRMPLGHAAAQVRHVRINLRHLLGVAEVEDGGAFVGPLRPVVIGPERSVPEEARNP